jgi:AmmeMemoRadiSam system protein B/AmmeMemoRadiSam system protein A
MKPAACHRITVIVFLLAFLVVAACAAPAAVPDPEQQVTTSPAKVGQAQGATPIASPPRDTRAVVPAVSSALTVSTEQVRPSGLAGTWYPDDPDGLAEMVDGFLDAVEPVDGQPLAIVVPHAGFVYSGPVAAHGFKQLEEGEYEVAVIIAADHQLPLSKPISVWAEGGFETPLGVVPVDEQLAGALVAANPGIVADTAPHHGEHPIEIELPFLQRVCPGCRIVPVLMGSDSEESVEILADALASLLPGRKAVIIASSDLSHYPAYFDARAVDGATLAAIETGDSGRVRETIDALMSAGFSDLATCACGEGPILATMRVSQELGAGDVTVLKYANSGDTPYGDRDRVVGYGAVMFWNYRPPDLTEAQRQELLELARTSIVEYLQTGDIPGYEATDSAMARRSGAFVTIKKDGELRGCIGNLRADTPLYQRVQELAVAAATADPRFPPMTIEELDEARIEISTLSPLRRITDLQQIEVGIHGLVIHQAGQQGVLLPQVPLEEGWDRDEFLENLCLKAGLMPNCLADQPALYAFTAMVFGDQE